MSVLAFHPVLAKFIVMKCLGMLERIHILKHRPERAQKMEASMDQYNATASYLRSHMRVIVNVLAITFLQRFALFLSHGLYTRHWDFTEHTFMML